ncbi:hypothetical protein BCV70DRAFT_122510 [Testicularia cyperi]|uniref:Matrin-type domain-containing protein n=1 Tax=Testicularia cyperi TaxID=1882483 RepID=A0A317XL15_9BASI|nr:hypothetical protein BCV70DRAFT_122510 [Testicularia cyperi]
MADVWISRKRWTCKYCNVTVNDDAPSRQHHESGQRHKNNVERALEQLYRTGERERQNAETARREMDRIERLAAVSYAKDQQRDATERLASGSLPPDKGASSDVLGSGSKQKPEFRARKKPDAARAAAATSATSQSADEQVQRAAQPGDWEEAAPSASEPSLPGSGALETDEPSDRQHARAFRLREKTGVLDNDADESDDDALAQIKVKRTKLAHLSPRAATNPTAKAKAKAEEEEEDGSKLQSVKAEAMGERNAQEASVQDGAAAGAGLFKKRRAGTGAGARRVRPLG